MKSLFSLNKYLYKYRVRLLAGFFFIILSNIFAIYPARFIRHALDLLKEDLSIYPLFAGMAVRASFAAQVTYTVLLFGLAIIFLALLKGLFMFFMRQTIIVVSRYIEYDLKNEIYRHYQYLPLSFYRKNNTGDMMARISEDVGRVRMYLGPAIMYTLNLVVLFVLVTATMLSVNARLTVYVLLPLPVLGISIFYVSSIIERKSDSVQAQLSRLSTFVQESISGIRVIKSFSRENISAAEFEEESILYKKHSLDLAKVNALFTPAILLLVGLSTLLTIYVGGREAMAGRVTYGNIAEFIYYVNMLTWPFASVGWVTSLIQRAGASQERINEFLRVPPVQEDAGSKGIDLKDGIAFRNVSFTYPGSLIRALEKISFEVGKGESLAILGKTGSGKSTVAALLTKMYEPDGGEILIGGKNISGINTGALREITGYVPQDVFLFSDTISNNIAFGMRKEDVTPGMIEQAAKTAAVYDDIMEFPQQFSTLIGERGVTLSGGQKQRVSIARAVIREPAILIFDDCLSAVDTQTEEKILTALSEVMRNRTSVIISHRVSSVKNADRIILLDDGRVLEQGTHESLMACKGSYFEMYESQLLDEAFSVAAGGMANINASNIK